jgi:hypothetical protein
MIVVLHPDSSDMHDRFRIILDVVEDAQVADAELPRSERIRSQELAVTRLHVRLMGQLFVNGVHHDHAVSGCQGMEVILAFRRILDAVDHGSFPFDRIRQIVRPTR